MIYNYLEEKECLLKLMEVYDPYRFVSFQTENLQQTIITATRG